MTTTTAYYTTPTNDPSEPEYHDVTVTELSGQLVIVDGEQVTPAQSYGRSLFCYYDRTDDKDLVARANKLSGHGPSTTSAEDRAAFANMFR